MDDPTAPDPEKAREQRGRAMYASQFGVDESQVEQTLSGIVGARMAAEAILAAGGEAWHGPQLSDRERSLVVIACLATQGGVDARLRGHLRWARQRGIPFEAIESALILLSNYAGQPKASVAMELLRAEEEPGT
jgi:4-carboxymuconolactone decarboxylase